jgi:hypothetical protein
MESPSRWVSVGALESLAAAFGYARAVRPGVFLSQDLETQLAMLLGFLGAPKSGVAVGLPELDAVERSMLSEMSPRIVGLWASEAEAIVAAPEQARPRSRRRNLHPSHHRHSRSSSLRPISGSSAG